MYPQEASLSDAQNILPNFFQPEGKESPNLTVKATRVRNSLGCRPENIEHFRCSDLSGLNQKIVPRQIGHKRKPWKILTLSAYVIASELVGKHRIHCGDVLTEWLIIIALQGAIIATNNKTHVEWMSIHEHPQSVLFLLKQM